MPEPRVILDATAVLNHTYFAAAGSEFSMRDADGTETASAKDALSAFFDLYLLPICEMVPPRRIIAVWDGGSEYRKTVYAGYKARRAEKKAKEAEEKPVKVEQFRLFEEHMRRTLAAVGAVQVTVKGVEGDDMLAYLCDKLDGEKVIYTTDADILQLDPREDVTVFVSNELITGEYKGIPTDLLCLYKSMVGDASDEYPGIKGFGPKAWDKYVEAFGMDGMRELDRIVRNKQFAELRRLVEEEGDPLLAKLAEKTGEWAIGYRLASLHPELCEGATRRGPVEPVWYKGVPDTRALMEEAKFAEAADAPAALKTCLRGDRLITADKFDAFLKLFKSKLEESPFVAFDYEAYDSENIEAFKQVSKNADFVDVLSHKITGASFTFGKNLNMTVYIPTFHKDTNNVPTERLLEVLRAVEEAGKELTVQNASFEVTVTKTNLGHDLGSPKDTKLMARYIDENESSGLKSLSSRYLRYRQTTYKEVVGDRAGMHELTAEEVFDYGCDDAICTAHLRELYEILLQCEGSRERVMGTGMSSTPVLTDAFISGVAVDYSKMEELAEKDAETIEKATKTLLSTLEEYYREPNEQGAETLFREMAPYLKAVARNKVREKGVEDPQTFIDSALEKARARYLEGSFYTPPMEVAGDVPEFKPTATQLSKVAKAVGIEQPIEKVTAKGLTEWLVDVSEGLDGDAETFVRLLTEGLPEIRKREGEKYEALRDFCHAVLVRTAPKKVVGDELNFGSTVQMQCLLYAMLGLPVRVRTKVQHGSLRQKLGFEDGAPATDEDAIRAALSEDCPDPMSPEHIILTSLLEIRESETRFSLYYKTYPLWKREDGDREGVGIIHPQILDCGTATRRPTGSSPNILQVSKTDEIGLRSIIVPRYKDHVIISPDFSGQELRILASETEDPVLLDAYIGPVKKDVHSVTSTAFAAEYVMQSKGLLMEADGLSSDEVMELAKFLSDYDSFFDSLKQGDPTKAGLAKKIRRMAKTVNFLIIYGGGPSKLALKMMVMLDFAKSIMRKVFDTYGRLAPWKEEVV